MGAGGQKEFKFDFEVPAGTVVDKAMMYVASPGGAVAVANGLAVGDQAGVSAWIDFSKTVLYEGFDLKRSLAPATAAAGKKQTITVMLGHGFWTSPHVTERVSTPGETGTAPVGRILFDIQTHETSSGAVGRTRQVARILQNGANSNPNMNRNEMRTGAIAIHAAGRKGPLLEDDPFSGTTTDWTLQLDAGWEAVKPVDSSHTSENFPKATQYKALAVPRAASSGSGIEKLKVSTTSVTAVGVATWVYKFSRNIVGQVLVATGSYHGKGRLVLKHCEIMNATHPHLCSALGGLPNVTDVHLVDSAVFSGTLRPKFTWHGFQYVVVEAFGDNFTFDAKLGSLSPQWTVSELEESATIEFAGPDAELLSKIRDITKASQISNMAGYIPTDCPTREKHGWLGDAQVTAEEAMYNVWSPAIYELFLDMIVSEQITNTSDPGRGGIPPVAPGKAAPEGDISWTAAFPLITNWLVEYYGDTSKARELWPSLVLYIDGLKREALGKLPQFWEWGDWCSVQNRTLERLGTGPPAAAANYILAVEAMVKIAHALDLPSSERKYASELEQWRAEFDKTFWDEELKTYTNDTLEVQTLSSIALGAGAVPATKRHSVMEAFLRDIEKREYHLTVGSAGSKWFLRQLSAEGAHEHAMKLATQTTHPSFGYWIGKGATTCWENWSGVQDDTHPCPGGCVNPPTHNHIFLCGGVGEWMYRSLGGIAPASAGYRTVAIAPAISRDSGPSGVNSTVLTVRGTVKSSWKRATDGGKTAGSRLLATLTVSVPVGMAATISIPLLGQPAADVFVIETNYNVSLWRGAGGSSSPRVAASGAPSAKWLLDIPRTGIARTVEEVVVLVVTSGEFKFEVATAQ